MSSIQVTGKIKRIFVSNDSFIIASISSDNPEFKIINFKGSKIDKVALNDKVTVFGEVTHHPKFGPQMQGRMLHQKNIEVAESSDYKLTQEQVNIIEKAKLGYTLKIKAFAGTGKTSTLVEIAKQIPARGLYLAYNKSIQLEAQSKFPVNVICKTAHSLAYGYLYNDINKRVKPSLTPTEFMHFIDVSAKADYSAFEIAFLAIKVLRLFCISWHKEIADHFFDHEDFAMLGEKEDKDNLMRYICSLAEQYWQRCSTDPNTPLEHDFYLKMFQLRYINLSKRFDYIMFDEAQDANPVLLNIVNRQSIQKIYVGDSHQQIYSWRGAINAMRFLDGEEAYLTQSFRFGVEISRLANIVLKFLYEKEKLAGFDQIDSKIVIRKPKKYTLLSRTNAKLIMNLVDNRNKNIHVIGGIEDALALAKGGFALYEGRREDIRHPKLKYFHNWEALVKFNENFSDPDTSFLVKIIEKHEEGFGNIIKQIEFGKYVSEHKANVVLSTIHKAKGREWDNVILDDDFGLFQDCECFKEALRNQREEFNLLYVGITRAKKQLFLEKGTKNFIARLDNYVNSNEASDEQ